MENFDITCDEFYEDAYRNATLSSEANNIINEHNTNVECTVVNKMKNDFDIYIGRGSKWGNPFNMKNQSQTERDRVCKEYEKHFWDSNLIDSIGELEGKVLGCYCTPKRCHGDFLAKLANTPKFD